MSEMELHRLMGTAFTDAGFCEKLLRGDRATLLAGFDLSDEEQKAILAIEAESIQEFAAQLREQLNRDLSESQKKGLLG